MLHSRYSQLIKRRYCFCGRTVGWNAWEYRKKGNHRPVFYPQGLGRTLQSIVESPVVLGYPQKQLLFWPIDHGHRFQYPDSLTHGIRAGGFAGFQIELLGQPLFELAATNLVVAVVGAAQWDGGVGVAGWGVKERRICS